MKGPKAFLIVCPNQCDPNDYVVSVIFEVFIDGFHCILNFSVIIREINHKILTRKGFAEVGSNANTVDHYQHEFQRSFHSRLGTQTSATARDHPERRQPDPPAHSRPTTFGR